MHRRPLLAVGLVTAVVGVLLLALGLGLGRGATSAAAQLLGASVSAAVMPSTAQTPTGAGVPRMQGVSPRQPRTDLHLGVPGISLRTPLRAGVVSQSGTINPPAGQAMWLSGFGRVVPGDVGTAVVAGHVASSGDDDVFAGLSGVRVGHRVVVTSSTATMTYVVKRAEVVTKDGLTQDPDVWGQNTSQRRIVLITCDDELGFRRDGHRIANYVVVADAV